MRTYAPLIVVFSLAIAGIATAGEATGPQLEPGAKAPAFTLKGTDGKMHTLDGVQGQKGTAVIFTCNHCPYAKAYEDRLIELAKEYAPKGIGFVAISANDPKIAPEDGFDQMVTRAKEKGLPYPYLFDAEQTTAKAFGAQVTPHVFLFDASGVLRYRGRVDDSAKPDEVKSRDFANALAALAEGREVPVATTKAFGCSVKWKKAS